MGGILRLFIVILFASWVHADTSVSDVAGANNLYASLGYPPISGWVAQGGDPCGDGWLGVYCDMGVIVKISLVNINLGGTIGEGLGSFRGIRVLNLCNNKIGGNIPPSLPPNLEQLLLSGNKINGLIPPSIASLSQIVAITLDHNQLVGIIPEAFQRLPRLARIDLSYNNLSGQLPVSMQYLTSLTSFILQDNSLEGSLAVLEDLPLTYLNIMHNNFHPIPKKFFDIPNFKCSPEEIYSPPTYSPPTFGKKKENNTRWWLALGIVGGLIVLVVLVGLFIPRNRRADVLVDLLKFGSAIIGCCKPSRCLGCPPGCPCTEV